MFRHFESENYFHKDNADLGQYSSYAAYNRDLLRLVDFYGQTPFDWYRNKKTGELIWLDGHAKIDHYSNLGHTWGKTFINGNRLLLDGETKLITYNGEIIHNFSKKKKSSFFSGGFAFSDGGNYQDPSSLRRGGRDVTWIDFGGAFEALITILGFETKGSTSRGKGTNGGKPTYENKMEDGINATDFGASATKEFITIYDKSTKKGKHNLPKKNEMIQIDYNSTTQNRTWISKEEFELQQKKKK
ncbi:hypothetical protein OIU83_22960 [Flavobacterium sp. LS1R49]|uniref:Uncharacterized protein n=1 Tax=Flavobacterium shii TaxID=2987687 RepID=A0A9X3C5J8_9FLAO|nr:hypothetical protein [Flavobacterium shii]MCV9930539.1 hypothetical protein [Flavobacterium shii]